jgi:membrane protein DedA with SNARE-associated domain/rhodanese-related sulfurtransferase
MKEMVEFLAKHGYWLLFIAVLGRQACLPVPALLLLLAAGALAGLGTLSFTGIIACSVIAFLVADLTWYAAGRRWGSRTLQFVCGFMPDPTVRLDKIAKTFDRYGARSLLVSKFIVGLDAVAAPMSGASRMELPRFLVFDGLGAILWSSVYATLGYVFSDQLDRLAADLAEMGKLILFAGVIWFSFLMVRKIVRWHRFLGEFRLARITPEELGDKLKSPHKILVLDLQGGANQADAMMAIPGAVRIDPRKLNRYIQQYRGVVLDTDREVILYCDSPSEARSARVALALRGLGFEHVRPLAGGFQAWRKRGLAVTSSVRTLPPPEQAVYVLREVLQHSRTNAAQFLKTTVTHVDQLMERALKHIGSTKASSLVLPESKEPEGLAEGAAFVPATVPVSPRSTP